MVTEKTLLDESAFVRDQVQGGNQSALQKYSQLVIGSNSLSALLKYELLTLFLGNLSGALGLVLRKKFYPTLFRKVGRNVVFGKNITVRCGCNIELGDNVVIDDNAYIDGRGAGDELVKLGDNVIIGRDCMVQSKIGRVHIGANTAVGSHSAIVAQGGITIGSWVGIAGGVKIFGGLFELKEEGDDTEPPYIRYSNGPITIGDGTIIASGAFIADGISVGQRAMIGPQSLVLSNVPDRAVVTARPAMMMKK